jgi:hypothetical protein
MSGDENHNVIYLMISMQINKSMRTVRILIIKRYIQLSEVTTQG